LGSEYHASVEALRWLAPILILRTVHRFYSNSLTGAGFQGARTAAQAGVALFNVLLNLWLIPAYSWRGAAWSSLASDALLLVSTVLIVDRLGRFEREANRAEEDLISGVPEVSTL
jgi:O-antigen/teichoic acid export membrane protein